MGHVDRRDLNRRMQRKKRANCVNGADDGAVRLRAQECMLKMREGTFRSRGSEGRTASTKAATEASEVCTLCAVHVTRGGVQNAECKGGPPCRRQSRQEPVRSGVHADHVGRMELRCVKSMGRTASTEPMMEPSSALSASDASSWSAASTYNVQFAASSCRAHGRFQPGGHSGCL